MKRETTTVLAIGLIALSKAQTAIMIVRTTGAVANAIIPITATILLAVAALLVWKGKRSGIVIAVPVIAFFLLQFFLLGLVQKMLVYFLMHVFAIGANIVSWSKLENQTSEQHAGQVSSEAAPSASPDEPSA